MVGLTELYRVQRGDVAAERLHRKDGDLVADISGGATSAVVSRVEQLIDAGLSLVGQCGTHPETTFASCQHLSSPFSLCVLVYICVLGGQIDVGVGQLRLCLWVDKEGATPYMTGNSEDASLWDWQIG